MDTNFITGETQQSTSAQSLQAEREIAELYEQYEKQISAYALRRTSSADANDVVAETFLTAWRRREDIPAEPKTLPWLYGVSRRVLANQRRSDDRRSRLRDRLTRERTSAHSPVTLIESADAFGEVTEAIRSMSDADAEILRLTAWEGLGPTEIAEALEIEPTAARQRLFRARQRLTEQLDKQAIDKTRREKLYKVAAAIVAILLTAAGLIGAGLLRPDSTIETDLIDQEEGPERQGGSGIGEGEGDAATRSIIETEGDASSMPGPATATVENETPEAAAEAAQPEPLDEATEPEAAEQPSDPARAQTNAVQPNGLAGSIGAPQRSDAINSSPAASTEGAVTTQSGSGAASSPEQTASAATTTPVVPDLLTPTGPFTPGVDLFVFHLDFADLDDGHAAVATAEAAAAHGVDVIAVAGTAALDSEDHTHDYGMVMNSTYGNAWVDAGNNRALAIDAMADEWIGTMRNGGDVWVAEGGVSDFTADVVREVQNRRPDLDTASRIHVVHHSTRNVNATSVANLALIQNETEFIKIDDGNDDNGTGDLFMNSDGFEAATNQSQFSAGWAAAFAQLPADELDFSDTITALYVLGVDKDQVATTEDFQQLFLS